jgi:hypothetical protein
LQAMLDKKIPILHKAEDRVFCFGLYKRYLRSNDFNDRFVCFNIEKGCSSQVSGLGLNLSLLFKQ